MILSNDLRKYLEWYLRENYQAKPYLCLEVFTYCRVIYTGKHRADKSVEMVDKLQAEIEVHIEAWADVVHCTPVTAKYRPFEQTATQELGLKVHPRFNTPTYNALRNREYKHRLDFINYILEKDNN